MIRIDVISQTAEGVVLTVEGRVVREASELLKRELTRWMAQKEQVLLDLQGVQFIDEAGIQGLQHWPAKRLRLRRGLLFIRRMLREEGLVIQEDDG